MNENPLKDIPIEKLKEYCMELGCSLVKMPEPLLPIEPCPYCGSKATFQLSRSMGYQIQYLCPNGCLFGEKATTFDTEPHLTHHEVKQLARQNWNNAVEKWKEDHK